MNLKPLRDQVIVKPIELEEVTKSGIVIPDTARKEKPQEGVIVAAGDGKLDDNGKTIPMVVKVGDKVIYSKYSGSEIKLDDEEFLIMREENIFAIVE
ncbi:MAG: co-chaperone GroES [Candidatus Aquicultor primus]|uniref:Co-chaperonin GroES n=1 Tax=Candidatus Aquicultor primus TaxID=1797195 RepID=A0A1F2URM9_9ACTN|nr:MAG: co-chaperone GroES [Candidatus Aquicultor primus]HCG98816.1 co-chaperone GroES [Actinomycetota bacterium]